MVMVMVTVTWAGVAIITDGAEGIIAAGDTITDDFYGEGRLIGGPLLSVRGPFNLAAPAGLPRQAGIVSSVRTGPRGWPRPTPVLPFNPGIALPISAARMLAAQIARGGASIAVPRAQVHSDHFIAS
jgi:hypothetical protein